MPQSLYIYMEVYCGTTVFDCLSVAMADLIELSNLSACELCEYTEQREVDLLEFYIS